MLRRRRNNPAEKNLSESIVDLLKPEVISQEEGRIEIHFRVRPELTIGEGVCPGRHRGLDARHDHGVF